MSSRRAGLAEGCFRAATELHPASHATAWNNLGKLLHVQLSSSSSSPSAVGEGAGRVGRVEEARAAYQQAVVVAPAYAIALFNLGLLELAHPSPSQSPSSSSSSSSPSSMATSTKMTKKESERQEPPAASLFRRAAAAAEATGKPSLMADALTKLGDVLLRDFMNDREKPELVLDQALTQFEAAVKLRPGDGHLRGLLGFAKQQQTKLLKKNKAQKP